MFGVRAMPPRRLVKPLWCPFTHRKLQAPSGISNTIASPASGIAQINVSAAGAQASICGNAAQGIGNAANTYANKSIYQNALYGQKPNALAPTDGNMGGDFKSWSY